MATAEDGGSLRNAIGTVVCPGDIVGRIDDAKAVLGEGLVQDTTFVRATRAGLVSLKPPRHFWIDGVQKRYVPVVEDMVIGVVTQRLGEQYRVDIGAAFPATLNALAFEGATKRNRPAVRVGTIVYARVTLANKDMEPELSCMDAAMRASGFGILNHGYLADCRISYARGLFEPSCPVLDAIGARVPYELAIGLNGRLWVNSVSPQATILVVNAVLRADGLDEAAALSLVERTLDRLRSTTAH